MKTQRTLLILFLILAWMARGTAQDVIYSQFYANSLYLNPAFAGSKLCNRLILTYRNQWPSAEKAYVSYCATWDQYYEKLSGSLGAMISTDVGSGGLYNRFSGSGIYNYRLQVSKFMVVNAAIQVGYLQYRLDWNKAMFGDQININTGTIEPTQEGMPPSLNIGRADFSAGLLGGFRESIYFGVAVNHLSRPNMSFYSENSYRLDMRWTAHAGMLIDFFQGMSGRDRRNFSISPNIVYVQQGDFHQLNLGMYINKYPLVGGLWMRHNFENPDAVIVQIGYQQKNYKVGYSFDYTISRLSIKAGGAHEVTLSFLFHKYLSPDRYHLMKNPEF